MDDQANFEEQESYSFQLSFVENDIVSLFKFVNRFVDWHKLPTVIGTFNLLAFRYELRAKNLCDGYGSKDAKGTAATVPLEDERYLQIRHSGGKWDSLEMPKMGRAGMRFGRNVPRSVTNVPTDEELMTPNPRLVSKTFMKRKEDEFKSATTLNLLAAFQVHDGVFHIEKREKLHEVPLPPGDAWPGNNGSS